MTQFVRFLCFPDLYWTDFNKKYESFKKGRLVYIQTNNSDTRKYHYIMSHTSVTDKNVCSGATRLLQWMRGYCSKHSSENLIKLGEDKGGMKTFHSSHSPVHAAHLYSSFVIVCTENQPVFLYSSMNFPWVFSDFHKTQLYSGNRYHISTTWSKIIQVLQQAFDTGPLCNTRPKDYLS